MRPKSLAEVARLTIHGEPFDDCLANFLDEFYASPDPAALVEQPVLLAPAFGNRGRVRDAYLAATAEELARIHGYEIRVWPDNDARKLRGPWFASTLPALRAVLLHESPATFRARNIFVSDNALTRA